MVLPTGSPGDGQVECPPVRERECPDRSAQPVPEVGAAPLTPPRPAGQRERCRRTRAVRNAGTASVMKTSAKSLWPCPKLRLDLYGSPRCPERPVPGRPPAAAPPHDGPHRVPSRREVSDTRELPDFPFRAGLPIFRHAGPGGPGTEPVGHRKVAVPATAGIPKSIDHGVRGHHSPSRGPTDSGPSWNRHKVPVCHYPNSLR